MSEEIKAGDLVRVVKPTECCGNTSTVNKVYYVSEIYSSNYPVTCPYCGTRCNRWTIAVEVGTYMGHLIQRLKRIPPPSLEDEVETTKELENANR